MTPTEPRRRRGRTRAPGPLHCDRCDQSTKKIVARWPDGAICYPCYSAATRTHGSCSTCADTRMLPGRDLDGGPICVDCAGIALDLHCERCSHEGERYRSHICARCALRDDLHTMLRPDSDDAARQALVDALSAASRPHSMITWLRNTQVSSLLRAIGSGDIELSHAGLDSTPGGKHVEHLRAIAVHHTILPVRDPHIARFEQWLEATLSRHDGHLGHLDLTAFAQWHHLRRIRGLPDSKTASAVRSAKQEISVTATFLDHLATTGSTLDGMTQQQIDEWLAPGPTTRFHARNFVIWAGKNKRLPRTLDFPRRQPRSEPTMDEAWRQELIRRCVGDDRIALGTRVAALLLLVYAQPLVRIAALECDDVIVDGETNTVAINLGDPPTPVPEPFGSLLVAHRRNRSNLNTGTVDSPWLFPSTRAGQHISPNTILHKLRDLGIDRKAARVVALRQLASTTPPAVVATMLGYSYQVTEKYAARAGGKYSTYANLLDNHPW